MKMVRAMKIHMKMDTMKMMMMITMNILKINIKIKIWKYQI